jgi:hypothetical protein
MGSGINHGVRQTGHRVTLQKYYFSYIIANHFLQWNTTRTQPRRMMRGAFIVEKNNE